MYNRSDGEKRSPEPIRLAFPKGMQSLVVISKLEITGLFVFLVRPNPRSILLFPPPNTRLNEL